MDSPPDQGPLSARALLRWQFRVAHQLLETAIERLSVEAIHRCPPGTAASPGACYAQVVLSEDLGINSVLGTRTPLALSTWAGRTGVSSTFSLGEPADWRAWAQKVQVDLAQLRPYARAVYASTDTYLAALTDDAFDRRCDEMSACVLNALLLTLSMRCGEIACLHALEFQPAADAFASADSCAP
jgi:DinB superfamily